MLLISEAIAEAKDSSNPLYITFFYSSKEFNMVDHTALLTTLYDLGIEPNLWHLYKGMYTDVTRVSMNGQLSQCVKEDRVIQKGGETSTHAFKSNENPFLKRIFNLQS